MYEVATLQLELNYESAEELDKALKLIQQVLLAKEKALGMVHPDTLKIVRRFAQLYETQNNLDDAELMYKRIQTAYETQAIPFNDNECELIFATNEFAKLLDKRGKIEESVSMYERALLLSDKHFGPTFPLTDSLATKFSKVLNKNREVSDSK